MKLMKAVGTCVAVCCLVGIALAKPLPKGRWQPLLAKGAKWTLPIVSEKYDESASAFVVEVTGVRKVGAADVVTLSYEAVGSDDDENFLPGQIAITKKGIYPFGEDATDAQIAKAIKKKAAFTDGGPTSEVYKKKNGTFALVPKQHPEAACFGFGATDATCGASPCYSWICLDDKAVVAVGGVGMNGGTFGFDYSPETDNWAP